MERKVGVIVFATIVCVLIIISILIYLIVNKHEASKELDSEANQNLSFNYGAFYVDQKSEIVSIKINILELDKDISIIKLIIQGQEGDNYTQFMQINRNVKIQETKINSLKTNITNPSTLYISTNKGGIENILLTHELKTIEIEEEVPEGSCNNDGLLDSTEECDDGNLNNNDACTNSCLKATCGDRHLYLDGAEECDGNDFGEYGNGINKCKDYLNALSSNDLVCNNCKIDTSKCKKLISAVKFDGLDDAIDISLLTLYEDEPYTISLWIKSYEVDDNPRSVFECTETLLSLQIIRKEFFFYMVTDANNVSKKEMISSPGIKPNEWIHLAVGYDHSQIKMYINGALLETKVQNRKIDGDVTCKIGYSENSIPKTFYGIIDDLRIYNKALTSNQVSQIYKDKQSGNSVTDDLVGWWKLDEGSGTQVKDSSTYNNTGIFYGNPEWVKEEIT